MFPSSQYLQRQKQHAQKLTALPGEPLFWGGVPNPGQYYEVGFGHDVPLSLPDVSQQGPPLYNKPVHNGNFRSAVLSDVHLESAGHRHPVGDLAPGVRASARGYDLSRARTGRQTPHERWESFVPSIHRGYVDADEQRRRLVELTSEYQGLPANYGLSAIN